MVEARGGQVESMVQFGHQLDCPDVITTASWPQRGEAPWHARK